MIKEVYKRIEFHEHVFLSILNIVTRRLRNETLLLEGGVLLMALKIHFQTHSF